MIPSELKEIVQSYFQGGGASDKTTIAIKDDLDAIAEFVEKNQREPGKAQIINHAR